VLSANILAQSTHVQLAKLTDQATANILLESIVKFLSVSEDQLTVNVCSSSGPNDSTHHHTFQVQSSTYKV